MTRTRSGSKSTYQGYYRHLCPKCEQHSPQESRRCGGCGAHLFVFCYRCGHENIRTTQKCLECGTDLRVKHRHHHSQSGVVFSEAPFSIQWSQVATLSV